MLYVGSIGHNNNNIMATNQQQNNNNNNNNNNNININNSNNSININNSNSNINNNNNNSSSSNNNGNSYGESTTSTSMIPPSITTSLTPTLSSQPNNIHNINLHQTPILTTTTTQVLSPMMGSKRKLEEDPIQSGGLSGNDFLLGSNNGLKPILVSSPLAQSPGLTSIQMAFANTSLSTSTPSTPLSMSPSLGPCSAPMSPSKKSKNSRNSKSKYLNSSIEDGQNSRWGNTTNSTSTTPSKSQIPPGGIVKGPWKDEEDAKLVELVNKCGPKEWSSIAAKIPGRIGKQCRERWFNHLSPEVRKTNWTAEEDKIIIDAHATLGNKWTAISKMLDGRPANAIKNHWNSTLLKRIGGSESKSSPSSHSKDKDDDDEDDDEEDGSSPVLSPISLYQSSDPSQQNQLNNSMPPFALSSSNSTTTTTTTTSNNNNTNNNNTPTINEPLVAPKIIRAQTTPNSSPSLSSKKSSHDKQKVPQSPKTIAKNQHHQHTQQQQQPLIISQPHIQQLPIDQQIQNIQIQYTQQPNVNITQSTTQQNQPTTLDQYQQYQLMQQYQQQYLQYYNQMNQQQQQQFSLQQQQHLAAQQQQSTFNNNVDMPFSIPGTTGAPSTIETQEVPYGNYYDYWGGSNPTGQPLMSHSDTSIPTSTSTTAGFSHEFSSMDPNSDFLLFDSEHNRIQPLQQHQHIKQDHAQISHLPYHPNQQQLQHIQQNNQQQHTQHTQHNNQQNTPQQQQQHSNQSHNLSQSQPAVSTTQTQDQGYINYDISSLFNVEI